MTELQALQSIAQSLQCVAALLFFLLLAYLFGGKK
jgi:hypothetical protein